MEGGDDRIAAPTASKRPEEVRVVVGVDSPRLAIRGDDLDRAHAVAREAILPPQPAEPPAERVADEADVGRGPGERAEPMAVCCLAQLERQRPGFNARGLGIRIDLDASHALGLDQDRVVKRAERDRPVPGALPGDPEAVLTREADDFRDVICALCERDRARALVGGEIPGLAGLIPVGVGRRHHAARDGELAEVAHRGADSNEEPAGSDRRSQRSQHMQVELRHLRQVRDLERFIGGVGSILVSLRIRLEHGANP